MGDMKIINVTKKNNSSWCRLSKSFLFEPFRSIHEIRINWRNVVREILIMNNLYLMKNHDSQTNNDNIVNVKSICSFNWLPEHHMFINDSIW
jgi:hypothetical protein